MPRGVTQPHNGTVNIKPSSHNTGLAVAASAIVQATGFGAENLWRHVVQGETGLSRNTLAWCDLPCWLGAVEGVDEARLPPHLAQWDCRNHRLAWMAWQDGGFQDAVHAATTRHGAHRVGLLLGTSTSGIRDTEQAYAERRQSGQWPQGFSYRHVHSVDALCRFNAEMMGLKGPMAGVSTACSSSAKVFLTAQRWMDAGLVDAVVVGGVDSLCLSTLHGFHALQLLSENICRPFDAARDGISLGEAAGFMLLDRSAAPIRFSGGGESSDAWHMSAPHPEGRGAQQAMQQALAQASLTPAEIDYVNAHGTATLANDRAEAAALTAVFGSNGVPVSSTKGITGHTLGAAGIVEAIIATEALRQQALPPSANLVTPEPGLAVSLVGQTAPAKLRHVMSNNFGFGGSNCSLIFSHSEDRAYA
jgi:3-oxoacyl-[acyl-carrier-protein] synthase-1